MIFLITIFALSALLLLGMVILKIREVEGGNRNQTFKTIASKLDPFAGRIVDQSKFFSAEVLGDIFRFAAAKVGLWTAGALISLRNFSSKLAAHLYHTSRKVQSGDPLTAHPSFFIKAILEFREKLKEDKENK
jgi:hypothetical protein